MLQVAHKGNSFIVEFSFYRQFPERCCSLDKLVSLHIKHIKKLHFTGNKMKGRFPLYTD